VAHDLVQQGGSTAAAWLHGIVHIQEGDLEDAEYWHHRAGRPFRRRGSLAEALAAFEAGLSMAPTVAVQTCDCSERLDRRRPLRTGRGAWSARLA
jgi:hypothetical protein